MRLLMSGEDADEPFVSFRTGMLTLSLAGEEEIVDAIVVGDHVHQEFVRRWTEAAARKLEGRRLRWRGDRGIYYRAKDAGAYYDEQMYIEAEDRYSERLMVVQCPHCNRNGRPLERKRTYVVESHWEWVGLSHQEPVARYLTWCSSCGEPYKFSIHTPQ